MVEKANSTTAAISTHGNQPARNDTVWNAAELPVFTSTVTRALPVELGGLLTLRANNANVRFESSHSEQLEVRVLRKVAAADDKCSTCLHTHIHKKR